jgi:NADP-dependent 3-hydroxy acid dehydrogenase YdfG
MKSIQSHTAVITGATSGIGEAAARRLISEGVRVVITGRNREKVESLAKELSCASVVGDITDPKLPALLLQNALQSYGRCDILINNAGVIVSGKIEEIEIERVCEMVRVNVEAAFRTAYTFLKHFKEKNSGELINISSVMGKKVRETVGAYAGTKWALEGFSEALRMELSNTPIRITCIEPGLVRTGLHREWQVQPSEMMHIQNPLTPEDIAEQIVHVLKQPEHIRIPQLMILPEGHVI